MGCGHSKINIYPRKSKSKTSGKKTVTPEKAESEEEDGIEAESENTENLEDCDSRKTIKVKPFGGPLLAQIEISTSQQDFFRMLDEKIQNGPDYNSESETEKAAESARLNALLKDWETASAGSRSVPVTPKRRPKTATISTTTTTTMSTTAEKLRSDGVRSAEIIYRDGISRLPQQQTERNYQSQIPQSVIHQSYGVTQVSYRQLNYNNPNYITQSPSHQMSYPSALQYQAISPMYTTNQTNYQPQLRQYTNYNQHGSPLKTFINSNNSPKHIPYEQHQQQAYSSPEHKLYRPVIVAPTTIPTTNQTTKSIYSNGELNQQQQQQQPPQLYNQYQQYKDVREQIIVQNQQQTGYRRNYQTSVTIPIIQNQQNDMNVLHRKQYELT